VNLLWKVAVKAVGKVVVVLDAEVAVDEAVVVGAEEAVVAGVDARNRFGCRSPSLDVSSKRERSDPSKKFSFSPCPSKKQKSSISFSKTNYKTKS
jgi:hypothetical protein